jgi:hypothetical protein
VSDPQPSLRIEIDPQPETDEQSAVIAAITALLSDQRTASATPQPTRRISRWAAAGRIAAHRRKRLRDDWRSGQTAS